MLSETTTKIVQNIEDRCGKLKSFDLNFNFEKSQYRLTDRDIGAFRSRSQKDDI